MRNDWFEKLLWFAGGVIVVVVFAACLIYMSGPHSIRYLCNQNITTTNSTNAAQQFAECVRTAHGA